MFRTMTSTLRASLCLLAVTGLAGCTTGNTTVDSGNGQDAGPDVRAETGVDAVDVPAVMDAADHVAVDAQADGGGTPGDHLLISEVATQPGGAEFVEIFNPGSAPVDLSNYYLSDNSVYYVIANGTPWAPPTMNPGTDFLVKFPAGTTLAAHAVLVIATDPGFEAIFHRCPDFVLSATPTTCAEAGTARAMVAPTNGDSGSMPGMMLSNSREMLVLFHWTGATTDRVQDVDYVTWGDAFEDGTRADKTGVGTYTADTARAMQHAAVAPALNGSIERCGLETGERLSGGNGITGHDETSERLDMTFRAQAAPTPGAGSACP